MVELGSVSPRSTPPSIEFSSRRATSSIDDLCDGVVRVNLSVIRSTEKTGSFLDHLPGELKQSIFSEAASKPLSEYLGGIGLTLLPSTAKALESKGIDKFFSLDALSSVWQCSKSMVEIRSDAVQWMTSKNAQLVLDLTKLQTSADPDPAFDYFSKAVKRYLDAFGLEGGQQLSPAESTAQTLRFFPKLEAFFDAALELDSLEAVNTPADLPRHCFFAGQVREVRTNYQYDTDVGVLYKNTCLKGTEALNKRMIEPIAREYRRLPHTHLQRELLRQITAHPLSSELSKAILQGIPDPVGQNYLQTTLQANTGLSPKITPNGTPSDISRVSTSTSSLNLELFP